MLFSIMLNKVKTTENEITIVEQEMKKKEARLALRMRGVHEHLAGLRDSTVWFLRAVGRQAEVTKPSRLRPDVVV